MPSIDYAEVKRRVTVRDLLRLYEWQPTEQHGDQLRGPCLVHRSARPVSRSFAVRGPTWYCHRCKVGGVGSLDLFMWITGQSDVHQAALSLCFLAAVELPLLPPAPAGGGNRKRNQ